MVRAVSLSKSRGMPSIFFIPTLRLAELLCAVQYHALYIEATVGQSLDNQKYVFSPPGIYNNASIAVW